MAELVYSGSVKNLWETEKGTLEFEYTDAYSVFDWGRMPDALAHKGESLAALGEYFFDKVADPKTWKDLSKSSWLATLLADHRYSDLIKAEFDVLAREGLNHHFLGRPSPNRLKVTRVEAIAPVARKIAGQTLYQYKTGAGVKRRLIPLEVVFRFGMPKGSSLLERLTEAYAMELGFATLPKEGSMFKVPVLEFFTKLEDTDRFLTWGQALNYADIDFGMFQRMVARTMLLACWLFELFKTRGLELWDGKFEWADIDGKLALVDSIGPDEMRLLDPKTGTQISKEFLRTFYRTTPWFDAMKKAKKEALGDNRIDWKKLVLEKAGEPPRLSPAFKAAADELYPSLVLAITGENPTGAGVPLPQMLERIRKCLG